MKIELKKLDLYHISDTRLSDFIKFLKKLPEELNQNIDDLYIDLDIDAYNGSYEAHLLILRNQTSEELAEAHERLRKDQEDREYRQYVKLKSKFLN
jgi:hypothetical protein